MSIPSFVERATALPDANSLKIQRIDGGWIVVLSNCDIPLACRTVSDVIEVIRTFLPDQTRALAWGEGPKQPLLGSCCLVSKIDGGWLVTLIIGPSQNMQFVRFNTRDIVRVVADWAGCVEIVPEHHQPPPIDGEHHQ